MSSVDETKENTVQEEEEEEAAAAAQDPLTAAASEAASATLSVKRISVSDVSELKQFKFKESLDEIHDALEVGIQVREFENPDDPEDPLIFAVDQLTAAEHSEIFDTLFDVNILKDALEENPEDADDIKAAALESIKSGAQETYLVKQARVVYKKMLFPEKRSVEGILNLPLSIQHELYEACTLVAMKVWRFQRVAETAEGGAGRDPAA